MLDQITYYITAITPALASITGIIIAAIALVKEIKKVFTDVKSLSNKTNSKVDNIEKQVNLVLAENAELKRENRRLKNRLNNVLDVEHEKK